MPQSEWFSLGFHVFALFCIWNGYAALGRLLAAGPAGVSDQVWVEVPEAVLRESDEQRYGRWKRATWIMSLCLGLPLPVLTLVLLGVGLVSEGKMPASGEFLMFVVAVILISMFSAILFGIPWLIFFAGTLRLRRRLWAAGQAGPGLEGASPGPETGAPGWDNMGCDPAATGTGQNSRARES